MKPTLGPAPCNSPISMSPPPLPEYSRPPSKLRPGTAALPAAPLSGYDAMPLRLVLDTTDSGGSAYPSTTGVSRTDDETSSSPEPPPAPARVLLLLACSVQSM
eukprot:scaffold15022_cov117-Isochrysis_galbana.AAC.12